MDRIVGIETEYGCLLSEEEPHVNSELWPAKVKNHLFRNAAAGTIDLHYRDYEEPPGNGGFLLQRRASLSRYGTHRVRVARMSASARCGQLMNWPETTCCNRH